MQRGHIDDTNLKQKRVRRKGWKRAKSRATKHEYAFSWKGAKAKAAAAAARKRGSARWTRASAPPADTRFEKISSAASYGDDAHQSCRDFVPEPGHRGTKSNFLRRWNSEREYQRGTRSRADQLAPNLRMASNKKANVISWLVQANDEPRPTKCLAVAGVARCLIN